MRIRYTCDLDDEQKMEAAAAIEGRAIRTMRRDYELVAPATRARAKRGVVRGKIGAASRRGLKLVPTVS